MTYRPSIPSSIDERADLYLAGKQANKNEVYQEALLHMLNNDGDVRLLNNLIDINSNSDPEWIIRLKKYCEQQNEDMGDVLNKIFTKIINEDGEPEIQFKERLDLNDNTTKSINS